MREIKFRAWDLEQKCWIEKGITYNSAESTEGQLGISLSGHLRVFSANAYKHYEEDETDECKIYVSNSEYESVHPCDTKPSYKRQYELMQFTGLIDKNGKEIYEGDIVALACSGEDGATKRMNVIATIIWNTEQAQFIVYIHDKDVLVKGGSKNGKVCSMREVHSWAGWHSCFSFPRNIEVIGNRYENPELLNE